MRLVLIATPKITIPLLEEIPDGFPYVQDLDLKGVMALQSALQSPKVPKSLKILGYVEEEGDSYFYGEPELIFIFLVEIDGVRFRLEGSDPEWKQFNWEIIRYSLKVLFETMKEEGNPFVN